LTLVATDIAARGIHVDDVALVIHADPPADHKAYLHRSGRTARAGQSGTVVTLMTNEQVREVKALTRAAGIAPTTTRVASAEHAVLAQLAPGTRVTTHVPTAVAPGRAVQAAPKRPAQRHGQRAGQRSGQRTGRGPRRRSAA
jgi:superfamily II DNA/RNA helicase